MDGTTAYRTTTGGGEGGIETWKLKPGN